MFIEMFDKAERVTVEDITLVVCLRAHEYNEWVLTRLERLHNYYNPAPRILIVDFGSRGKFKTSISDICKKSGFRLHYVKNYDSYSASAAHNAAYKNVDTDFIFFKDVDFLGERDLFDRLARTATAANMRVVFDTILDLPAYHVNEIHSNLIDSTNDTDQISDALSRVGFTGQAGAFGSEVEFIAPYSNVFLVNKKFFSVTGGYHDSFVGHGSEDFEYFMRTAFYSSYYPMPKEIEVDCYGPTKWDFWGTRAYRGFRALNQLICGRAERAGLKIFHIWHPTGGKGDWRVENDWKRDRLRAAHKLYAQNNANLLSIDNIDRNKSVICICKSSDHWGYFLPLRIHGYRLIPIYSDTMIDIDRINDLMDEKAVTAFAIFNPYMKSHDKFKSVFMRAKDEGLKTIVIERGALPNTIYYSEDVAYNSEYFTADSLAKIKLSPLEIESAKKYIQNLRTGAYLLEGASSREFSDRKFRAISRMKRTRIFIPLQLHDDMAVTKYVRNSQSYSDFSNSIFEVARQHPAALFLVKPHPLSKTSFSEAPDNVLICDREDNIHSILDSVDGVICYNSGVGLLAACHGKSLVTIGNAFYNIDGVGVFANDLTEAVGKMLEDQPASNEDAVVSLIGKYLYYRYSWFAADDDIREFKDRKAHGYKNIRVMRSVIDGNAATHMWETAVRPLAARSYSIGIANFDNSPHPTKSEVKTPIAIKASGSKSSSAIAIPEKIEDKTAPILIPKQQKPIHTIPLKQNRNSKFRNKIAKCIREPHVFFKDAKNPMLRPLRHLFKNT